MKLPLRLGIQQRVLPIYRAPFFDLLAANFEKGGELFAGLQRAGEGIVEADKLSSAKLAPAHNFYLPLGRSYLLWQTNILGWLRRWKPDCLIVEANPRNLTAIAAANWMHRHKGKVIGWGLGAPVEGRLSGLRTRYWRWLVSHFDGMIAYSQVGSVQYARLGFDTERIFISRNAVAARPTQKSIVRESKGKTQRATFLFVGRLVAQKRVDLLLRACNALPQNLQPEMWIVGEGPMRGEWEHLSRELYPKAKFYGEMHGERLDELFRKADLFVLPGTGGLAVQQAMSYSLPVIVGQADGTQADLVRSENGWQLPDTSVKSLKYALTTALNDVPALRKKGKASYAIVANEINLEAMVAGHTRAIMKVMELS